jgi:hypothetical protein
LTQIRYLLKSQANQVLQELTNAGWNPSDFKWEDTNSLNHRQKNPVSKLVHHSSGYYFLFDNIANGFISAWSPAKEILKQTANSSSWAGQIKHFKEWLGYLRREVESPDLWSAISKETELLDATSTDEANTPFSSEEKAYVLSGINEIKQYLLTAHRLDPELVEARLNYLAESSNRVGRKDWINLLLSVLVGIVMQASLPPEATRELFRFVGVVLRQILSHNPLLLP